MANSNSAKKEEEAPESIQQEPTAIAADAPAASEAAPAPAAAEPQPADAQAAGAETSPTTAPSEAPASSRAGSKSEKKQPREEPKAPKAPPRENLPWRQRVTLVNLLLWTVLSGIFLAGGAAGYYALNVLYENKLNDTWAILYLDLEQKGNRLNQQLEQFAAQRGNPLAIPKRMPDVVVKVLSPEKAERVQGNIPETLSLADLRLTSMDIKERFNLLQFAGVSYLALPMHEALAAQILERKLDAGSYLLFWRIDIDTWFNDSIDDPDKNTLYLITKEGRVIFTNEQEITEATFMKRPLVQKFVAAPLRQGQLEFDRDDGAAYGFFYEVPSTNLMMFVEVSKKVALASVREIAFRFGVVFFIILGVAGVVLQFPLTTFISPIRELVRLAWEVGEGNFNIRPRNEGFGELSVLTRAFSEMGKNLVAREERIQLLLVEQQEKFRLADELALAHSIQENFLIHSPLPKTSGVEVATHYHPAAEVAGDWYGYFSDERSGQSVFAIADVSGHGAGSAMFTAIIAALFEETRNASIAHQKPFPMETFALRLNLIMIRLGHSKMHATMLMARYHKDTDEIHILNAGHPFPLLIYPEETKKRNSTIVLGSEVVGMSMDFAPRTGTYPFEQGTSLLMYTDGLMEGRPDRKLYGERRLAKVCKVPAHFTLNQLVTKIYEDWRDYLDGQTALDDVCLMALRRAA